MVGLQPLVLELEKQLQEDRCLGLWGMRGLGKSTLATALCRAMQPRFPGQTCLVEFTSLEVAARGLDVQKLRQELVSKALLMLGITLQPHASPEQVRLYWRLHLP